MVKKGFSPHKKRGAKQLSSPLEVPQGKGQWNNRQYFTDKEKRIRKIDNSQIQVKRFIHTEGIKIENDKVLKPLVGRIRWQGKIEKHETQEYQAIKELGDLPHIPKDVTMVNRNGVPHLKRDNYLILEDSDYKTLNRDDLISIEKTIREANNRGWNINDEIQVGVDTKRSEYVVYDWSASFKRTSDVQKTNDEVTANILINKLWNKARYTDYIQAREWADKERFKQRIEGYKRGDKPKYNYTYMSFARPASFLISKRDIPEGDIIVQDIQRSKPWQPLGLIHTEKPIPQNILKMTELTPTKYEFQ